MLSFDPTCWDGIISKERADTVITVYTCHRPNPEIPIYNEHCLKMMNDSSEMFLTHVKMCSPDKKMYRTVSERTYEQHTDYLHGRVKHDNWQGYQRWYNKNHPEILIAETMLHD